MKLMVSASTSENSFMLTLPTGQSTAGVGQDDDVVMTVLGECILQKES